MKERYKRGSMERITIDLINEAELRLLLININKAQDMENKKHITLEQLISMLLAEPSFLEMVKAMNDTFKDIIKKQ